MTVTGPSHERSALFIDGANLCAASLHLGLDVDYRNLLQFSPLRPSTDRLAYADRGARPLQRADQADDADGD